VKSENDSIFRGARGKHSDIKERLGKIGAVKGTGRKEKDTERNLPTGCNRCLARPIANAVGPQIKGKDDEG